MDVFPTLVAATGVAPGNEKPLDGVNRWSQIQGAAPVDAGEIFFAVNGVEGLQQAIREGPYKLIRGFGFSGVEPSQPMLFDVEADPQEEVDLAEAEPERVKRLLGRLEAWADLHPPGGDPAVHWPHPGWIRPADYNAAMRRDPPL